MPELKERVRHPRPVEALFYRSQQAADLIGVSRSAIYAMIADGKLPASKARGATLIHRDDLMSSITPKAAARSRTSHENGGAGVRLRKAGSPAQDGRDDVDH